MFLCQVVNRKNLFCVVRRHKRSKNVLNYLNISLEWQNEPYYFGTKEIAEAALMEATKTSYDGTINNTIREWETILIAITHS